MGTDVKETVSQILTRYLTATKRRRTPERYTILNAVYEQKGQFTLDELNDYLLAQNFYVSRGTLYNTLSLLQQLRLVVQHHIKGVTTYQGSYKTNCCFQICTECGKVIEFSNPSLVEAINTTKLYRFRRDSFSLYIYGICSSCQGKATKKIKLNSKL